MKKFTCAIIGETGLALECAEAWIENGHRVISIISSDPAVAAWCSQNQATPLSFEENWQEWLGQTTFDFLFSIANPAIIPPEILRLPQCLAINYHNSLLPSYAGMNATSWALLRGERTHGVSWHVMTEQVDAGDILKQSAFDILPDDTALSLNLRCYQTALETFRDLVKDLSHESISRVAQNPDRRLYFGKNQRPAAACTLSFLWREEDVRNFTQALDFGSSINPLGLPKIKCGTQWFIVPIPAPESIHQFYSPGTIVALNSQGLTLAVLDGTVRFPFLLTLEGEKISAVEWSHRTGFKKGDIIPQLNADTLGRLSRLSARCAQTEDKWVKKLTRLQPLQFPSLAGIEYAHQTENQSGRFQSRPVAWPKSDYPFSAHMLAAAFIAYAARLTESSEFTAGFFWSDSVPTPEDEQELLSPRVPLHFAFDKNESPSTWQTAVEKEIDSVRHLGFFQKEIFLRHPHLKSPGSIQFPVSLAILDKAENLVIQPGDELIFAIIPRDHKALWITPRSEPLVVDRLVSDFESFLSVFCRDLESRVVDIPLCRDAIHSPQILGWNQTEQPFPNDKCLHQLFENQAHQSPNQIALLFENQKISYGDLNAAANQIAHQLIQDGIQPGDFVGIHMERSMEMIAGLLGILKSGAAYVPLDFKLPPARLEWIVNQLKIKKVLVSSPPDCIVLPDPLSLTESEAPWRYQPSSNPDLPLSSALTAYVIFTSGSTGQPKGVQVQHRPVINVIDWVNRQFGVGNEDRLLFTTSLSFDLSVYDIFGILAAGGSIRIVPDRYLHDPEMLLGMLENDSITFWDSAPQALQQLVPFFEQTPPGLSLSNLRLIFLSGDWIPLSLPPVLKKRYKNATVVALGGATEATIWSNFFVVDSIPKQWISIPYGFPIQNARYYILNGELMPVPIGIPGDLYIGGDCLAQGYANDPDLTAQRFIPDPFSSDPSARMYRTGDRARFWNDGTIEFLGRLDHQVKIRGFRIETGEVESALLTHPEIHQALVMAVESPDKTKQLAAYYVSSASGVTVDALRRHLQEQLPEYMIPSLFIPLSSFPLTENGKIDRKKLPITSPERPDLSAPLVKARTSLERQVLELWMEILGLREIGVHDNFFDLGGHSLLATRLMSRIRQQWQIELSLRTLFETPTVAGLSHVIEQAQRGQSSPSFTSIRRISPPAAMEIDLQSLSEKEIDSLLASFQTNGEIS